MKRDWEGVLDDGSRFNRYFKTPPGIDKTVNADAKLTDTLKMLPEKVKEFSFQANEIARVLSVKGDIRQTCYNIWDLLIKCIAYVADDTGKEQVRSVWRLWHDRIGDCDCFSFFTSSVLTVLNIPHRFRVAEYDPKVGYQHIYITVPRKGQKDIIIDAVLKNFDYEVPFTRKIDKEMNLEFLNGIGVATEPSAGKGNAVTEQDIEELKQFVWFGNPAYLERKERENMDEAELGSLRNFAANVRGNFQNVVSTVKDKVQQTTSQIKDKVQQTASQLKDKANNVADKVKDTARNVGEKVKSTVHAINRVNPGTTAVRLGIIQGLKLNVFQISERLRFAYLSDSEAKRLGVNDKRFFRYKKTRERLEKYFYTIGGDVKNLKEAILTGRGNSDKKVALSGFQVGEKFPDFNTRLIDAIGAEMYYSEVPVNEPALAGLGIVETAAAAAAGSSILAIIAGVLKTIGPLLEKGEPGADPELDPLEKLAEQNGELPSGDSSADGGEGERSTETSANPDSGSGNENKPPESFDWRAFYEKNKPLVIAGAVATTGIIAFIIYKKFFAGKRGKKSGERAMNGVGKRAPSNEHHVNGHSGSVKSSPPHKAKAAAKYAKAEEDLMRELRLNSLK
jgi:gas vesicle protein